MPEKFKNFIGGEWVAPSTGAYFENRNPADRNDLIGCFPRSGPDDAQRAVESARRGFAQWSKMPAPLRGQVLQRVGDALVRRKEEIARAIMAAVLAGLPKSLSSLDDSSLARLMRRACQAGAIAVTKRGAIPSLPFADALKAFEI